MINEPDNCINNAIIYGLNSDCFYNPKYAFLFERIIHMFKEKKETIDLITLKNDLVRLGRLNDIGGMQGLMTISESIATTAGFGSWCAIVMKHRASRMLLHICNKTISEINKQEKGIKQVIKDFKNEVADTENIAESKQQKTTKEILIKTCEILQEANTQKDTFFIPMCIPNVPEILMHAKKELHILGADSGVGKTGFCLTSMLGRIEKGYTGAIFCGESTSDKLMVRLISIDSGISADRLFNMSKMSKNDMMKYQSSIKKINDLSDRFYIFGKGDYVHSPDGIGRELRIIQDKTAGKLEYVNIDYLQNLRSDGIYKKATRVEQLEENVFAINRLFTEFNLAGTLLSQINRDKERSKSNKKPRLYDLKGASTIEQESDYVTFINRDTTKEGLVDVDWYSDKMRGSHRVQTVLQFDTATGRFTGKPYQNRYEKEYEPK